ncbi:Chromate resistance protein ChrB [Streptomyces sp. NPDC057611]|uniref:Chromate resistance protein ChrB n=1 Tax=Streptomyces sp. NPDC057611 TaxID=3346182 RepID=UPI00368D5DBC
MTETTGNRERFLLVSVSTADAPAATRVRVWRKLRSLGALYLQQSVCLLPDRDAVRRQVARLLASVRADGGTARQLAVDIADEAEYGQLIAEFNAERDAEYGEVVERAPELLKELEMETARGNATYAEVEESEADLERFDKWLAKIAARDHFGAPGGAAAREAVERCRVALAVFEDAAIAAQAGAHPGIQSDESVLPASAKLRAVE